MQCLEDEKCKLVHDEAPKYITGTCTHLEEYGNSFLITRECKNLDLHTCYQNPKC